MAALSLNELTKAIDSLEKALSHAKNLDSNSEEFKIARDACIQRFEFSIELSWKLSAKLLGSSSTTARPVIREMAQNKLIGNTDKWFEFIVARNKSSHSYDEDIAKEVYKTLDSFLKEAKLIIPKLEQL